MRRHKYVEECFKIKEDGYILNDLLETIKPDGGRATFIRELLGHGTHLAVSLKAAQLGLIRTTFEIMRRPHSPPPHSTKNKDA